MEMTADNNPAFNFLDSQLEKEAYIYDVLDEILRKQEEYLTTREGHLATLAELLNSRNIKMPLSPTRGKNITYLTDILCKKHPENVRAIPSFLFTADKEAKKLNIGETVEFSVNLNESAFAEIKRLRNAQTTKNLLELLSMFKSTNLTKLFKNLNYGGYLLELLQKECAGTLFFYKQYFIDSHLSEVSEDFCFHKKNYLQIKNSLSTEEIKKIITKYLASITRRMKAFGIMNINVSDISDYNDTKLDYLVNALTEETTLQADKRDIVTVKNFAALRECLVKAGQNINPLISRASDITAYIKNNSICNAGELVAVFPPLTIKDLSQWTKDDLDKKKILTYNDGNSLFFIDPNGLMQKLENLYKIIIDKPEMLAAMTEAEKKKNLGLLEILYNSGLALAASDKSLAFLGNEANVERLNQLLKSFEKYKNAQKIAAENRPVQENKKPKSAIQKILGFIMSFFAGKPPEGKKKDQPESKPQVKGPKPLSELTKDIISKVKGKNAPLIPLSDYIELNSQNEKQKIGPLIDEIRQNNLKIVIPVYNARTVLYPAKSQGYLMSDVEYLMVDPSIISSTDSVRNFTDSLRGYKIKDEALTGKAIVVIENYLLTLARQKRAQKGKKV